MILEGAQDWNAGLIGAAEGNHIDIVKLILSKGATYFTEAKRYAYEKNDRINKFCF